MKTEIAEIKEQFKQVLEYSQDIMNPHVDELFETFLEKKDYFIKQFGGFIKEIPDVEFTLDDASKEERINEFLTRIERKYKCFDLSNFISSNIDGFYDNEVKLDYKDGDIFVPAGMKLLKAFKFFVDDKSILTDIQNDASRLIQENKITGTLCFSVHPLDFLSSSENTHNWRSCHSLDGEYRGGNLSYMVDDCTFMCYLRSDGYDHQLPNFPHEVKWNSKKWRVLLYLSNDRTMLMAGRQYPFSSSTGMDRVIKEVFTPERHALWNGIEAHWSGWREGFSSSIKINDEYYAIDQCYPVGRRLKNKADFIKNNPHSLQFNDLLISSCYEPIYSFLIFTDEDIKYQGATSNETRFNIGGAVPCLACGGGHICSTEVLVCDDCYSEYNHEDEGWYCECCDAHMWDDDESYYVEGDYICSRCVDDNAVWCDGCNEWYYIEHTTAVEINGETRHYCDECWEEMKENGER